MSLAIDPIAVIEAAYAGRADPKACVGAICDALEPQFMGDYGRVAYFLELGRGALDIVHFKSGENMSVEEGLAVVQRSFEASPPELRQKLVTTAGLTAMSDYQDFVGDLQEAWGRPVESVNMLIPIGLGRSAVIGYGRSTRYKIDTRLRQIMSRLSAHAGAALRMGGLAGDPFANDRVEAVLEVDGSTAEARGEATTKRDELREAARAIDKARTKAGRANPEEALELWQGLLAGRWSLVDHHDNDGRRYFIAQINDPDVPEPAALTHRQRQVVFYSALGWGHKEVGYALGVETTTAAEHLKESLDKLGLESREQLIQLTAQLVMQGPSKDG